MARIPYVEKETCAACGLCAELLPTVFRLDVGAAPMKSEVFDPAGASEEAIQEVVDLCPVSCIHWRE